MSARRFHWLLPLLAVGVAYAPTPWSEFVWDDELMLRHQLPVFRSLSDVFWPPPDIPHWTYAFYRPLVVLTYLQDAWLFGTGSSTGPHVMNVAFHAGVTLSAWLLIRRILAHLPHGAEAALLAATVFAVHPIHTESVCWMAGRSDLLATLFLLPAVWLTLRWRDRLSWWAVPASAGLFLAALLSKETGSMGLLLVPLALLLVAGDRQGLQRTAVGASHRARRALVWGGLGVAWLAALAIYWWLRQAAGVGQPVMQQLGWPDRLERLAAAAAYYVVKVVAPWPQSNFVTWDMVPGRATTALLLLATVALAAWSIRLWRRRADGTALLAVAWFAGTLSLALWNAVGTMNNTPLAERHLYLPSVAMAIGVGLAYQAGRARGWLRLPVCLAAALIAVYLVSSVQRAMTWRSSIALWANVTARVTDYAMPWTSLAIAELRAGNEQRALELLLRAVATRDEPWGRKERGLAHNDIGKIYLRRGEVDLAEQHLRQSTTLVPAEAEPWFQLATIYARQATSSRTPGMTEQRDARAELAIKAFTAALTRDPANHEARLRLAGFLFDYGELLESEGRAAPALRRYLSALDQLQMMMARIPEPGRESSLAKLAGQTSIDPASLRRRIETQIERLGTPGNGGRL